MRFQVLVILVSTLMMGGCASIVSGQNQSVSVVTKSEGTDVAGAKCSLTNDKGQWYATTPGSVTVRRSYGTLAIDCKTDQHAGTAQVKSTTKGMAFGNIIFGGVIGVGVDVATGAAYDYPEVISVPLVVYGAVGGNAIPVVLSTEPLSPPVARPSPPDPPPATMATLPATQPTVVPVAAAVPSPPLAVTLPVVVTAPPPQPAVALAGAVVNSKRLTGGQDAFQASRAAQGAQCHANPQPVLIGKGPGAETYSVACTNGDTLAIRCEFGNCRALK